MSHGHVTDALLLALFFPDSPVTAKFLRKDEKVKAVKRVAEAKTGVKNTEFKIYQVWPLLRLLGRPLIHPLHAFVLVDQASSDRPQDVAAICCIHRCPDPEWVRLSPLSKFELAG